VEALERLHIAAARRRLQPISGPEPLALRRSGRRGDP
jgi:hypothetical protein